ncbi:MAG: lactonase family protein [Spirochaetia bacterium]|nr:lactonase family protein [Spirochaetia bacterium]
MQMVRPFTFFLIATVGCFPPTTNNIPELALLGIPSAAGSSYSKLLFTANSGDITFRSFRIDQDTGALTLASTMTPAASGIGVDIHPNLPYVYQTLAGSNGATSYTFDRDSGALTFAASVSPGDSATHRVHVRQDGSALYFNSVQSGQTWIYRSPLSSGIVQAATLVDFSEPANSQFLALHPTGNFLYGTSSNSSGGIGGINTFLTNNGGTLVSQGNTNITGVEEPAYAIFTSDGTGMFFASNTGTRLLSYAINQSTGVPTVVSNITVNAVVVLMHPNEQYLYVTDSTTPAIRLFQINADKSLSLLNTMSGLSGSNFATGCMDRAGRFLYLTRFTAAGEVAAYKVNSDFTLTYISSAIAGNLVRACVTSIDR